MDASEAEEFAEITSKLIRSLPYDTPEQTYVAFEKHAGVPAVGKFSNILRFVVKEVLVISCEVIYLDSLFFLIFGDIWSDLLLFTHLLQSTACLVIKRIGALLYDVCKIVRIYISFAQLLIVATLLILF